MRNLVFCMSKGTNQKSSNSKCRRKTLSPISEYCVVQANLSMLRCLKRIRRTCSMSSMPYSCAMLLINWTSSVHDLHFKISGSIVTNFQSKSMTRLSVILPS